MDMRRVRLLVLLLTAALLVGACGGDDDDAAGDDETTETTASATATTVDRAAAEAEIRTTFEAFFDGTKPVEDKVAYLEDGEALRESLVSGASGPTGELAKRTTTRVTGVEFLSDEDCDFNGIAAPCAKVTHDLVLDGTQVALEGQSSYAVLVDGEWKLSKISYCGLQALGGTTPDVCK